LSGCQLGLFHRNSPFLILKKISKHFKDLVKLNVNQFLYNYGARKLDRIIYTDVEVSGGS
jgi:hypothetical protein